jgi:hypothetical protein
MNSQHYDKKNYDSKASKLHGRLRDGLVVAGAATAMIFAYVSFPRHLFGAADSYAYAGPKPKASKAKPGEDPVALSLDRSLYSQIKISSSLAGLGLSPLIKRALPNRDEAAQYRRYPGEDLAVASSEMDITALSLKEAAEHVADLLGVASTSIAYESDANHGGVALSNGLGSGSSPLNLIGAASQLALNTSRNLPGFRNGFGVDVDGASVSLNGIVDCAERGLANPRAKRTAVTSGFERVRDAYDLACTKYASVADPGLSVSVTKNTRWFAPTGVAPTVPRDPGSTVIDGGYGIEAIKTENSLPGFSATTNVVVNAVTLTPFRSIQDLPFAPRGIATAVLVPQDRPVGPTGSVRATASAPSSLADPSGPPDPTALPSPQTIGLLLIGMIGLLMARSPAARTRR